MSELTTPVRGLDRERIREFLHELDPALVHGELRIDLLEGGRSNLTYLLQDDANKWVLRRPPLGHVQQSAHDMGREARFMQALAGTDVPVPEVLVSCESPDVIGAPFYIMRWVDGAVFRTVDDTSGLGPDRARRISAALVDTLARLHEVDVAEVGLDGVGRPKGFMDRQVQRFSRQLDNPGTRDIAGVRDLAAALASDVPVNPVAAIVHGDYRLDNVLVGTDDTISAVLDWELATVGDPLADLGLLLCYWDGVPGPNRQAIAKGIALELGFPASSEIARQYEEATQSDLSRLSWYVAFGYFKMAVIREGIHQRHLMGETVGEGFATVGVLVQPLVDQALRTLEDD